jgi:hypothetical protein
MSEGKRTIPELEQLIKEEKEDFNKLLDVAAETDKIYNDSFEETDELIYKKKPSKNNPIAMMIYEMKKHKMKFMGSKELKNQYIFSNRMIAYNARYIRNLERKLEELKKAVKI